MAAMRLTHCLAPALLLCATVASAGIVTPEGPTPNTSSREEYRACLDDADRLKAEQAQRQQQLDEHNQKLAQVQAEMRELTHSQASLDAGDPAAVDAFNAKVATANQRMAAVNEAGQAFNKQQDAYNSRSLAYNKRCAGMVVSRSDRLAVDQERAAQGKK